MDELIEILFDKSASISERDDAAMDLSDYDSAIDALIEIASDVTDNPTVLGSCGTSISEIWMRLGIFDESILALLAPQARAEIEASF
jgi:hypothetical protein